MGETWRGIEGKVGVVWGQGWGASTVESVVLLGIMKGKQTQQMLFSTVFISERALFSWIGKEQAFVLR